MGARWRGGLPRKHVRGTTARGLGDGAWAVAGPLPDDLGQLLEGGHNITNNTRLPLKYSQHHTCYGNMHICAGAAQGLERQ